MRAALLLGLLLLPAVVQAEPRALFQFDSDREVRPPAPTPALILPARESFVPVRHGADIPLLGRPGLQTPDQAQPVLSIGPFQLEQKSQFGRKRRMAFPGYRIGGLKLFGGSLGGSVDGRGGSLSISWHTN